MSNAIQRLDLAGLVRGFHSCRIEVSKAFMQPLDYPIRKATVADVDVLLHHRRAMFTDMGVRFDPDALARAFVPWLRDAMARELFHGWVAQDGHGAIVGGAGLTVLPWPPRPDDVTGRLGYIYNMYVEREHRRRGIARRLIEAVHDWSRANGIQRVALHASDEGRPLYESLGYTPSNEMRLTL
jgi:GNAT superfamily N-acetyltransferase